MRIYIPFRESNAVRSENVLSGVYEEVGSNSVALRHFEAFRRRQDAVAFMDKFNRATKYPVKYKIVAFESQEAK
jgi:hypothetical protein